MTKQPTSEECSAVAVLEDGEHERLYAFWHPQWGGYCAKALFSAPKEHQQDVREKLNAPGAADGFDCFNVTVWHDGEFPRNDDPPQRFHYCDPMQLVDMGLLVAEKQIECGLRVDGMVRDDLERVLERVQALLAKAPS